MKLKKQLTIYSVLPQNIKTAYLAFLHRDRKFSDEVFYQTHCGSRKVLLWIAKNYPHIEIKMFFSVFAKNSLKFVEIKEDTVEFLTNNQYTEKQVIELVL